MRVDYPSMHFIRLINLLFMCGLLASCSSTPSGDVRGGASSEGSALSDISEARGTVLGQEGERADSGALDALPEASNGSDTEGLDGSEELDLGPPSEGSERAERLGEDAADEGPLCGNGVLDPLEECDDGADNGSYGHCLSDCSGPGSFCGDGVVDNWADELCDDGINDALEGGCLPGCQSEDLSDQVFDDPLVMIEIELPSASWESLRHQAKTRHGMFGKEDCRNEVIANPYTWFKGSVTINGTTIEESGLRKKGHLGSQSTLKPSLKVKFHEFVSGQNYKTLKRFALNNGKNDKSYVRTCMAYSVFRAAGIPAPRCTRAHVSINGVSMGPYVLVEEYKKPFMRRHFSDISGNLYEGTACDWRPEFFGGFEQETNLDTDPSKSDLQAVMTLMESDEDEGFIEALGALFDLDKLYRFWAVESLIWHRDGYSGNANNYMVYADPALDGRFVFLPWGPDGAFNPDNRAAVPDSVLAFGALVHRLYMSEAGRTRFYEELNTLLDTIWDPEAMVAEAEALRELLSPHLLAHEEAVFNTDLSAVQTTISERQSVIEEVLVEGHPEWSVGMRSLPCTVPLASISGSFETTWGSLSDNIWNSGSGSLELLLDGENVASSKSGARAGWKTEFMGRAQLHFDIQDEQRLKFIFNFPDTRYFDPFMLPGVHPLIRPPMTANLVLQDLSGVNPNRLYELGEGTWTFVSVGDEVGDAIAVEFEGTLYLPVGG